MLALLRRSRGFTVFLGSQGVSNLGDAVTAVVVPLFLLQLTHSPVLVAALALLETVPRLVLQLPAGALVDRWDRRRVLAAADVGRGLLTLAVPVTALLHGPVVVVLFAITVPLAVLSCLFGAGFQAMTPALVGRDGQDGAIERAYALVEGMESAAWIAGPPVAGLLVALIGGPGALAVDGVSFLFSAAGLLAVRVPRAERPAAAPIRRSLLREMLDGLRFLATQPVLRGAQLSWSLYGAIGNGVILGLVYVGSGGGTAGPGLAAAAVATYAAGSLLGTLLAGWRRLPSPSIAVAACLGTFALGALLAASGPALALPAGGLLVGLGEGYFLVVVLTLRAEITPEELMGRVSSAAIVISQVVTAIAVAWMGVALQVMGGRGAFAVVTALAVGLAAWVALARPLGAAAR